MWLRVLDFARGLWKTNAGKVITAFKAKASKADSVTKASKRRGASSLTKHFPLAPDGTLKFGLQWSHCRLYQ